MCLPRRAGYLENQRLQAEDYIKAMRFGNLENIHLTDKEIIYGKQEVFLYSQTALLR